MRIIASIAQGAFDPESIRVLETAFQAAWKTVNSSGCDLAVEGRAAATREVLAERIIEMAERGVRDPRRLVEHALAHLVSAKTGGLKSQGLRPIEGLISEAKEVTDEAGDAGVMAAVSHPPRPQSATKLPIRGDEPLGRATWARNRSETHRSGAMSPSSTATLMTTVPGVGATVTSYDKQNVYDPSDSKIGERSN